MVADARTHKTRAEEVITIECDVLELHRDPALDTKPAPLGHRGDIKIVDVRNDGMLPGLAAVDVGGVPARIDRDGAHQTARAPSSAAQLDLVSRVKAHERLTIRAVTSGGHTTARATLEANPPAGDPAFVDALVDPVFAGNARWLPRLVAHG